MIVTLDLPDSVRAALGMAGYTAERFSEEALRQLAAVIFTRKVLSLGQAAELARMSLWDFIPFLGQQGIPYLDYDEVEWEKELEDARWLVQQARDKLPSPRHPSS